MYSAGWNMPGYLPEMDPMEFGTFEEAKQFILNELTFAEDATENEEDAEEFCHMAEEINLYSHTFHTRTMPDGYTY